MEEKKVQGKFNLVSVREAAEYLGYSSRTIYNMISAKKFPIKPRRIGRSVRFDVRELDEYISSH